MFGRKENASVKITTMLGLGSNLQGDFSTDGSARIDGNVYGNVKVGGMLILGSGGKISGDVEAESAVIGGEVLGNVVAPEKTELTETAKVMGDVTTRTIVIDENAIFQGRCNMVRAIEPQEKEEEPAPKTPRISAKAALQEAMREMEEEEASEEAEEAYKEDAPREEAYEEPAPAPQPEESSIARKMREVLLKDAADGEMEQSRSEE